MALPPSSKIDSVAICATQKKWLNLPHTVIPATPGCAVLSGRLSSSKGWTRSPSRMLPFGLKLAWFALSLSGLIGCWAVLLPLAWAMQSYWGPIAYAVGITGLQGIFCLGLIWRMNPAYMPRAFCTTQVLVTGLATFFITGVLAAITTATTVYVAKPKQWSAQNDRTVLPWRYYYLFPMVFFPLLASVVHITFVIFFDTFEAYDGLNCVARPLWIRFLGFAGTPFIITIPCLWLTSVSALRVMRTHRHIRRARRSVEIIPNPDHFTTIPQRRSRPSIKTWATPPTPRAITAPSPAPSSIIRMSTEMRRQPISPVLREEKIRSYHLPFYAPSPEYVTASSGHRSRESNSFDTISSVSFAEMENKSKSTPRMLSQGTEDDDIMTPLRSQVGSRDGTTRSTRSIHNSDRISITQLAFGLRNELEDFTNNTDHSRYDSGDTETSATSEISTEPPVSEHRNPSELPSLVRSLILFQFAIIAIHLLSSITPIIDLISSSRKGSVPAAIGTQHVALLLAGWGPVFIFGPLSAVRSQLAFWRR
ncbi:hypothetical protein B0H11DRAFT_2060791 [Mycena galericulata]|nr:hypothetical protein B0H11DRAFT_2060791 [Mycena galericulata]